MTDDGLVVAMKARELGKGSVVVGDRVALAGDASGAEGSLARIVRVEPRTSALRRSADDTDPQERIIVANADQMVIVSALAEPAPNLRFIDRCLVAAYDAGLDPLLVLTKADLASPRKVRAFYTPLGLPMLTTRRPLPPRTLSRLRAALTGRISVLIGPSGVGKSTLVNTLVPAAARTTGIVNPVTGRGRHTSSSVVALPLGDGWLIDTPGLRGFGLGHVSPERVVEAFGDLAEGAALVPAGLRPPLPRLRAGRVGPRAPRRGQARLAPPRAAQPRRRPRLVRGPRAPRGPVASGIRRRRTRSPSECGPWRNPVASERRSPSSPVVRRIRSAAIPGRPTTPAGTCPSPLFRLELDLRGVFWLWGVSEAPQYTGFSPGPGSSAEDLGLRERWTTEVAIGYRGVAGGGTLDGRGAGR